MKTRDGEPLGGGASAASDFADVGQSVATPAAAPYGINPITGQPYTGINPITGQPM